MTQLLSTLGQRIRSSPSCVVWIALCVLLVSNGCASDDSDDSSGSGSGGLGVSVAGASGADGDFGASSDNAAATGAAGFSAAGSAGLDGTIGVGAGGIPAEAGSASPSGAGASGVGGSLAQAGTGAGGGNSAPDAGPGSAGTSSIPDVSGSGGSAGSGEFPPLTANVTLHVAGDSTAAVFPASDPTRRVGWAAVLQQFFSTGVQVSDAAQSGRSSKSFIDEGSWNALKSTIRTGDYVFIQFGHNDEKQDDPARYSDPSTTFRTNLKTYVSDTRAAGGIAVLLTPISRRQFSGSRIVASHGAYPAAVLAVAQETGAPVIDMTEKTRVLLESLGPTGTVSLFATDDNTHLSAKGAPEVAKLAVLGIRELGLPLAQRLVP